MGEEGYIPTGMFKSVEWTSTNRDLISSMNKPPLYSKPNETVRDSLKPLNSGFGGI